MAGVLGANCHGYAVAALRVPGRAQRRYRVSSEKSGHPRRARPEQRYRRAEPEVVRADVARGCHRSWTTPIRCIRFTNRIHMYLFGESCTPTEYIDIRLVY